ncbi:Uncharacterized protein ACO02O_10529 [Dirofilaria immitis]
MISGNAIPHGLKVKKPLEPGGVCFAPFNFCAKGYKCVIMKCVEEIQQRIAGNGIGPCFQGTCPNNYACHVNNRCYLAENY